MEKHTGSLFNQKYFDGFSKRIVLDENQCLKTEFVYEGAYYKLDASDLVWMRSKVLHMGLTLFSAAALILLMTQATAGNTLRYMIALQVLLLFSLLGLAVCAVARLGASRRMTRWEYRMAVISLREFAGLALVFCCALLALSLVLPALSVVDFTGKELSCTAGYLCCGAALLWMRLLLKRERYLSEESQDMPHGIDVTDDFSTF